MKLEGFVEPARYVNDDRQQRALQVLDDLLDSGHQMQYSLASIKLSPMPKPLEEIEAEEREQDVRRDCRPERTDGRVGGVIVAAGLNRAPDRRPAARG